MKSIFCTDTHFDEYPNYQGKMQADINAFNSMYIYAVENGIKNIYHLGDLFDKNDKIPSCVYGQIFDIIQMNQTEKGIKTTILMGNHTTIQKINEDEMEIFNSNVMRPFQSNNRGSEVIYLPTVKKVGDLKIAIMPFSNDKEFLVGSINLFSKHNPDILLGHFALKEALGYTDAKISLEDIPYEKFGHIYLGHLHHPSELKENVHFIGSMFQRNFAEENVTPGFWVVDIEKNNIQETFTPVEAITFRTIQIKNDTEYQDFLKNYNDNKYDGNIVRIKYGKNLEEITRTFGERLIEPNKISNQESIQDLDTNINLLFERYVHEKCDDEEIKSLVLKVGNKILEKAV